MLVFLKIWWIEREWAKQSLWMPSPKIESVDTGKEAEICILSSIPDEPDAGTTYQLPYHWIWEYSNNITSAYLKGFCEALN